MTRWSIRQMALPAFVVAAAVLASAASGDAQRRGRYKKDGDNCVWAAESGPNQCTPRVAGRFKKNGEDCVWDAKDAGPDQCRPANGRWKTEGDRCVWTPKDSGPDQCNPRQPR